MIKPVLWFENHKKIIILQTVRTRVGETEEKLSDQSYHYPGVEGWQYIDRKQEKKKSTSYK